MTKEQLEIEKAIKTSVSFEIKTRHAYGAVSMEMTRNAIKFLREYREVCLLGNDSYIDYADYGQPNSEEEVSQINNYKRDKLKGSPNEG